MSLLALVPLIAVVFALFAAFPVFSDISVQLKNFIFANFMPAAGNTLQRYLEQFVANVHRMTAVGAVGLIVTALLLMHSVDSALNAIWRSHKKAPAGLFLCRLLDDIDAWAVAGRCQFSHQLLPAVAEMDKRDGVTSLVDQTLRFFPLLLSWLSFWLLYSIVPTQRVPSRDALTGGAGRRVAV